MASAGSPVPSSRPAYPPTPAYDDDLQFVTAYLTVHLLTDPSRVYVYILWIAIATVLVAISLARHFPLGGGHLRASWSRWALRRRTWRKKHTLAVAKATGQPHQQPYSLPSNAQIFTLAALLVAALLLTFLGPDYFAPGSTIWTLHNFPTATTTFAKRASYDMSAFLQYQPQYTISKAWWSSGNRTGLIAFALLPLCVLFAVKSPPFAILSLPFFVQLHFDKLVWLHKCTAYLIYFLTLLHVAFWSVQLCIDRRNGKLAYTFAWQYEKFLFAWTAFGCMTLLFVMSIKPFRRKHYEAFWFLHVLLVLLTIIMAALHHPPVWWWCWAALGLWIGERTWRFTWWLYTNGFLGGKSLAHAPSNKLRKTQSHSSKSPTPFPPSKLNVSPIPDTPPSNSSANLVLYPPSSRLAGVGLSVPTDYVPPPGFAHAELLPGRTVRLRIVTPGYLTWAPGQHFLISVPSITRFTTHPFTAASICDEQNPYDDGRVLVFLIRAKTGWTKDLWDLTASMLSQGQQYVLGESLPRCEMPGSGVLFRACVDGPYGSSVRASWGSYSSILIVAGGSGVGYALSILQYVCLCLVGRDGAFLGGRKGGYGQPGFKTTRVRFVWLVREFGHIQWCASVLRRCMDMVPASELQIDIFVTNVKPHASLTAPAPTTPLSPLLKKEQIAGSELEPPHPEFAARARPQSVASFSSEESGEDSDVDLSYYTGGFLQDEGELGHEEHVLDLTNFEGDDDTATLPGEAQFNLSVRQEGRARRRYTRRASMMLAAKQELAYRASLAESEDGFGGGFGGGSTVGLVGSRRGSVLPPIDTERNQAGSQRPSMDIGLVRPSVEGGHELRLTGQQSPRTPLKTPNSAHPLMTGRTPTAWEGNDTGTSRGVPTHILPNPNPGPSASAGMMNKRLSHLSHISERSAASTTRASSRLSQWTNTDSFAALVPRGEVEAVKEQLRLDVDAVEAEDVRIVAEHARPGKPRLERILADEVERAGGAIAVTCCGPTSLDAVVRKIVAAQIDPARIWKGDMRGSISLYSEEFSY